MSPFVDQVAKQIKWIAKNKQERARWHICKFFKVLPTNPDFLNLTMEQIAWMGAHVEIDNREAETATGNYDEQFHDPTFEEWAERYERGETDDLF